MSGGCERRRRGNTVKGSQEGRERLRARGEEMVQRKVQLED